MDNVLFFLNPKSNSGTSRHFWQKAAKKYNILPEDPLDVTKVDVAVEIAKHKPKIVAIAGGDGTINAVCTVVSKLQHKPALTIIPLGLGNALSFCLGVETIDKAVDVLSKSDKKITVDMMKTNIEGHERGVFNISAGFDARIVFNKKNIKYIGIGSYILSALRSMLEHSEQEIRLTIDHSVTLAARASSLVVANCPIIGQNFVVAQNAKMNDGQLDCTLFSTRYAYMTNLRMRGFKHPLYTALGKVGFKASHIRIEGEPFVQIDGDPTIKREGIEIEILPSQVTFLRNNKEHIDQAYLPFV